MLTATMIVVFIEVTCPPLQTPPNAVRAGDCLDGVDYVFQTICNFECKRGYKTKFGQNARQCKDNGQWSGKELQCSSKYSLQSWT